MTKALRGVLSLFFLLALGAVAGYAQSPTGGILGTITDPSAAVIPNARITVTNVETSVTREVSTSAAGNYLVTSLLPGNYRVRVEVPGFKTRERMASVITGSNTNVDFQMEVGSTGEVVVVEAAAPQIVTDSHRIDGVVQRNQIDNLPLNGRNFLQLALLEPGVTVEAVDNPGTSPNNFFRVSIAGAGQALTRISVDGATTESPAGRLRTFPKRRCRSSRSPRSTTTLRPA